MAKETLRGHLDMLVLAVVDRGASHGYAIAEHLRLVSAHEFDLPEGTLYPALYRLEADGRLASQWKVVDGRRRRVYRLTRTGRRELARQKQNWASFSEAVRNVLEVPT